jgi:hypothetical protein
MLPFKMENQLKDESLKKPAETGYTAFQHKTVLFKQSIHKTILHYITLHGCCKGDEFH